MKIIITATAGISLAPFTPESPDIEAIQVVRMPVARNKKVQHKELIKTFGIKPYLHPQGVA